MKEYLLNIGGINVPLSIVMFLLGFLASRLTLTKKEKKDIEQKQFENGKSLAEKQQETFQDFSKSLHVYVAKVRDGVPTSLDEFFDIATKGEKYFYQARITANAIMAGNVDRHTRDTSFVPGLKECIDKTLPQYYSSLQNISKSLSIPYNGELKRENYESIYCAVERYGRLN